MSDSEFNEQDVRKSYRMLAHTEETEIRLIDPHKKLKTMSKFVKTENKFVEVCKEFNGKYNIYAGINERRPKGKEGKDVISCSSIVTDIDPIRQKGIPSTESELNNAFQVAIQIINDSEKQGFKKPNLAMSGNGYYLWFKIPKTQITNDNRVSFESKVKLFIKHLQDIFNNEFATIDQIGDLPRIIKIIGTKSIKGQHTEERPHRLSYWGNLQSEEDKDLLNEILKAEVKTTEIENYVAPSPKTKEYIKEIFNNEKLQKIYDGKWKEVLDSKGKKYFSRSEPEWHLICTLVEKDLPKEQVFEVMNSCKIGKWQETTKSYREHTYKKALKTVLEDRAEKEEKEQKGAFKLRPQDVAEILCQTHKFISTGDPERMIIYHYENGIYVPNGKKIIHSLVEGRRSFKSEVINYIYSKTIITSGEIEEESTELICLENGILDIFTKEFIPHSPDYIFLQKIPIKYDKTAKSEKFESFLCEILPKEHIPTIKKLLSYTLIRDYRYQVLFIFVGEGENGKSTLLATITSFLGKENTCSVELQRLEKDKFARAYLYKKLANIVADIPSDRLPSVSIMKSTTGGDQLSAEHKFGAPFNFVSYAKQIYSCNRPPAMPEDSIAVWRRLIVIEFPNRISQDKKDPLLLSKLTTEQEMSGILNLALDSISELQKSRFMSEVEKTKQLYVHLSDSVHSFVIDKVIPCADAETPKKELFSVYAEYCRERNYGVEAENVFFQRLPQLIKCSTTHPRIDHYQTYCMKGIVATGCTGYFLLNNTNSEKMKEKGVKVKIREEEKLGKIKGKSLYQPYQPQQELVYALKRSDFENAGFKDQGGDAHIDCSECGVKTSRFERDGKWYCKACAETKVTQKVS